MTDERNTGQSAAGFHRIEDLMICPRRFGYRQVLGLVPIRMNGYLALGTAVHEALAAYYTGEDWIEALRKAPESWAWKVPQAAEIVGQYVSRPGAKRDILLTRGVDTEKELAVTIGGLLFTRRIDRLFLNEKDEVCGGDHKTSGQPIKRAASINSDASLFTQEIVGRAVYGDRWGGMLLNIIGTARSREGRYEFLRRALAPSPVMLSQAVESLHWWLKLAEFLTARMSPWDFPQTWRCQGRYPMSRNYQCEYLDLCRLGRAAEGRYVREET